MAKTIYLIVAIIVIITDVTLGYLTLRRREKRSKYLGVAFILAAFQEASYTVSMYCESLFDVKIALACFFTSVPYLLIYLAIHIMVFAGMEFKLRQRIVIGVLWLITLADTAMQFTNPFIDFVVGFKYNVTDIIKWEFIYKGPFYTHLIFCYLIIAGILFQIIKKMVVTPKVYRAKYFTILVGLIVAVAFNFVCIFLQGRGMPDYSQLTYSLLGAVLYYDMFSTGERRLFNSLRHTIFDGLGHPIILFGENNALSLMNEPAESLFPGWKQGANYRLNDFIKQFELSDKYNTATENSFFLWTSKMDRKTYQVDYRVFKDKRENVIGRMFVYTDTSYGIDLLTGFMSRNAFDRMMEGFDFKPYMPAAVGVLDINKLAEINKKYGKAGGDKCIESLAESMKKNLPEDTLFIRGNDANLLAIAPMTSLKKMRECLNRIKIDCYKLGPEGTKLIVQSAVAIVDADQPSVFNAIDVASFSMLSRKLMDKSSNHSSLLDSFAQTLMEADETTEAHVNRTKKMGEMLALRLNFTDSQVSDLLLLCLLHDIGKLGIPLEILNKPSKLTASEWEVMKSHAEKGYRIAKASKELEGIAEFILCHHESWNGSGYPNGLRGESIPLLSRVISIIDAYDAMTNDRPYHQAISDREAREEIKRCSGTQFDPYLASEFLQMLDEIKPLEIEEAVNEEKPIKTSLRYEEQEQIKLADTKIAEFGEYILDSEDRIIAINENFTKITGYTEEDIKEFQLYQWSLIPAEDRVGYVALVGEQLDKYGRAFVEHRICCRNGNFVDVFCMGAKTVDPMTRETISKVQIVDIESSNAFKKYKASVKQSLERHVEEMREANRKDPLTGILNHEAFAVAVESALLDPEKKYVLMLFDIDNFKSFNDSFGHMEGDRLLVLVAGLIYQQVMEIGFAGRLGGDELACLFEAPNVGVAERKADLIYNAISEKMNWSEKAVSISTGAVYIDGNYESFSKAYREADNALYETKRNGRNGYTFKK